MTNLAKEHTGQEPTNAAGLPSNSNVLLNCPFCGGGVEWCDCGDPKGPGCHRIQCGVCGEFDFSTGCMDDETLEFVRLFVAQRWNARAV